MKETEVSVKTVTEIAKDTGRFEINCFADMLEDGTTRPSIFQAQIPDKEKVIDNVEVKEGELALSYKGKTVGELNKDGELIVEPDNDDPNKYSVEDQNLKYEQ